MINEKLAAKALSWGVHLCAFRAGGLLGRRSFRMRLEAENPAAGRPARPATMECRYILLAICNAEYYGGGFQPVPGADSTDGLLEICQVDNLGAAGNPPLLPRYRKGTHLNHPAVHRLTVRKGTLVSLDGTVPLLGNMDGEVFTAERLEFECLPSALRAYRSAPAET
jgi:diacylglycerol kinase family enzyme